LVDLGFLELVGAVEVLAFVDSGDVSDDGVGFVDAAVFGFEDWDFAIWVLFEELGIFD